MKKMIIGLLIFLFFIFVPYVMEEGSVLLLFKPSPIMIVFGGAAGLTLASYRKGMDKQAILRRAKKYLIFCGYFGSLCGIISVLNTTTHSVLMQTPEIIFVKFSIIFTAIFLGYLSAYIVDTFIAE